MKKPLNEKNILEALRVVKDPDLHRDIVALNFVKNMKITERNVSFEIELTTPACPVRDELKAESVRAVREQIEGIGEVNVTMTSNVMSRRDVPAPNHLAGVRNTIAVASGKGGVGKSTVAVNLAVSLARDGARVGLVDADVYGPSIPLMMGINGRPAMKGQRIQPMENWGVKVMSIGFLVEPMQAVIWRGPMASGAVKQFLTDVDWGELDYLLIDLPPGTGDIQLTLVQTIPLTGAVIVTTPQDISLADARKGFVMFQKVNVPILGIVENMSYYICSSCGHRDDVFAHGGGEKAAGDLGVPFLGGIPLSTDVRVSGDTGKPIVMEAADQDLAQRGAEGRSAQAFRQIARSMAAQLSILHSRQNEEDDVDIRLFSREKT